MALVRTVPRLGGFPGLRCYRCAACEPAIGVVAQAHVEAPTRHDLIGDGGELLESQARCQNALPVLVSRRSRARGARSTWRKA
jgi:hypothetical protein